MNDHSNLFNLNNNHNSIQLKPILDRLHITGRETEVGGGGDTFPSISNALTTAKMWPKSTEVMQELKPKNHGYHFQ